MRVFHYEAISQQGDFCHGSVEVKSSDDLRHYLNGQQLELIRYRRDYFQCLSTKRLSTQDIYFLALEWSQMLQAGLPLLDLIALQVQQEKQKHRRLWLQSIHIKLEQGQCLSDALENDQRLNKTFITAIKAGEQSGSLDQCLYRLAESFEHQLHIKQKVQQALIYPLFAGTTLAAVAVYLLHSLVPQLADFLHSMSVELPWYTAWLIAMSDGITSNGLKLLLGGLFGITILVFSYWRWRSLRLWIDKIILSIPVIGKAKQHAIYAQMYDSLGLFYQSGVSWVDATRSTAQGLSNLFIQSLLLEVSESITTGAGVSKSFQCLSGLSDIERRLLSTGEKSGSLDKVLPRLAKYRLKQLNSQVENAIELIQPTLIFFIGGFMLWIVAAVFLPIYDLVAHIGGV